MARAFTPADVVQANNGTSTGLTDPGIALGNAISPGGSGVMMLLAGEAIATPAQWDVPAESGFLAGNPQLAIACRACVLDGEQSWPMAFNSGSTGPWIWFVEEWANLSYAPILSVVSGAPVSGPASRTLG